MLTSTIAGTLLAASLVAAPASAPADLAPETGQVIVVGGPEVGTDSLRDAMCAIMQWC